MSHPGESSGAPVVRTQLVPVRNSVARESTENFKEKLFAKGLHYEECFRKICDAGCPDRRIRANALGDVQAHIISVHPTN